MFQISGTATVKMYLCNTKYNTFDDGKWQQDECTCFNKIRNLKDLEKCGI